MAFLRLYRKVDNQSCAPVEIIWLRGLHDAAGDFPGARHAAAGHQIPLRVERFRRDQHLVPRGRPDGHHRPYQPDAQPADRP